MHYQVVQGDYTISTDQSKLDIGKIHQFLSEESYWSQNIPLATVEAYIPHSLCFGLYETEEQIGFARLITDYTTFAYMADVFIIPTFRGRSLGKWLIQSILSHPQLQGLRRWFLFTEDAHELYQQYGFDALPKIHRAMAKINFTTYPRVD